MIKRDQRGFTLIELLVAMAIVALIAGAATMATFQVINVTKSSNDRMTVIRQVQNAGYWISHDTLMAEHMIVDDDPETAEFLILTWTEWGYGEDTIYHRVTYSFQDLSDGIGKLKRTYWSSAGASEQTLVAQYIDLATASFSEQDGVWKLTIQACAGTETETREYEINPRVNI